LQLDDSTGKDSDADLWPLEVLKNCNRLVQRLANALDPPDQLTVIFRCAVRKIKAGHVDACCNQLRDHFLGIRSGADRADYLRAADHFDSFCLAFNRSSVVFNSGASARMRCASSTAAIASLVCPIFSYADESSMYASKEFGSTSRPRLKLSTASSVCPCSR